MYREYGLAYDDSGGSNSLLQAISTIHLDHSGQLKKFCLYTVTANLSL